MNTKPLVIYHGNCADGFGAAWVMHKTLGHDAADYVAGVYQNPPPEVYNRNIFMVDFSYKNSVVKELLRNGNRITLIDHHKTAIEDLEELIVAGAIEAYTSLEHSGATLTWQYFHGKQPAPQLLYHIEDRDLWKFALPLTRQIQASVFSFPYEFPVWDELMSRNVNELAAEGEAIERKHFKDIRELLPVVTRMMYIDSWVVPVANLPYVYASDAGHILSREFPFGACYWDTPEGRVFSLRSAENGIDVSEVAKKYGGGGHKHAAGFRVSYEVAAKFELTDVEVPAHAYK